MDVEYPAEAETFRTRIRTFLAEHLPAGWSGGGALPPDERTRSHTSGAAPLRTRD